MKVRGTELKSMLFGVSIFGLEFVHFRQIYLRSLVLVFKTGVIVSNAYLKELLGVQN